MKNQNDFMFCLQQNYTTDTGYARCDLVLTLQKRGCTQITNPESETTIIRVRISISNMIHSGQDLCVALKKTAILSDFQSISN